MTTVDRSSYAPMDPPQRGARTAFNDKVHSDSAPSPPSAEKVTLSAAALASSRSRTGLSAGYSTLLTRLFHVTAMNKEPGVETVVSMTNTLGGNAAFLTHADRNFLAYAYQYADAQGIAPEEVDRVASDLGSFRIMQLMGNHIEVKPGERGTPGAPPHYWLMTASDTAIASRILTSNTAAATPLDHDFIANVLNPRGCGWTSEDNVGHSTNFAFLEKLINASGANTFIKVDPDHPEPLYQNSLYWIRHQDIPDLPPPSRNVDPTATGIDSAMFRNQLQANSESSPDYVAQALALRKLHQDAPKPGTRAEKKAAYRARILERQQTVTSLLRDFIAARLGSF